MHHHHVLLCLTVAMAVIALLLVRKVPKGTRIVDGDTIAVRGTRWRLAGFDAPESDQPGGTEATERLRGIIGRELVIGVIYGVDPYRRLLVRCYTLRGPLSWRMMASGHAHATSRFGLIPTLWARIRGHGVWDGTHAVVKPMFWRATHPRPVMPNMKPYRAKRSGQSSFKRMARSHRNLIRTSKKFLH